MNPLRPGVAGLLMRRSWRHHLGRQLVALGAVALGVALAWSVHLINQSALSEFAAAVRSANGEPDLQLRGPREGFDDALFDRVVDDPRVVAASPVVELETAARTAAGAGLALRVIGVDALRVATLAPELLPRPDSPGHAPGEPEDRLAALDPHAVFLNAAARQRLGVAQGQALALRAGGRWVELQVAGVVAAGGGPLLVMDIAGAQHHFGFAGRLHRIDLQFLPGTSARAWAAAFEPPAGVTASGVDAAVQRTSHLSRAYRVNLTVLALVALFVGGFLVYSVVALSVAQRTPALALLGVLGMTARERRRLILLENGVLGALGSLLGLGLGTALAWAALRWMAGDLGGGYFPGIAPTLQLRLPDAGGFFLLGTASALLGAWLPARQAERLVPALALKGLGSPPPPPGATTRAAAVLLVGGGLLALLPPVAGLPLAAYASVAALLAGGVALVPAGVHLLLQAPPLHAARLVARPLPLLAVRRAGHQRHIATAAVAGVVASLALSVALTVMVASFRDGVARWLDEVLPADLYARTAASTLAAEQAWLDDDAVQAVAAVPGVARVRAARVASLPLQPELPAVTLVTRSLADPAQALPLVGAPLSVPPGLEGVFVSEAMVSLHGARPGSLLSLPVPRFDAEGRPVGTATRRVFVRGVWRDYARQFGSVAVDDADWRRWTGDRRHSELALWLSPGQELAAVQQAVRQALPEGTPLEFASARELRQLSLRIFDRSFAVTRYLQAVAIGIGLVGVAASLSAQVLARRKEFGLLAHLGLTRGQVLRLVAAETAAWMVVGVAVGLGLGLAVSAVLVFVVNPQSFHWTMPLVAPAAPLAALAAAVLAAGVMTGAWSARRASAAPAVQSVREDW